MVEILRIPQQQKFFSTKREFTTILYQQSSWPKTSNSKSNLNLGFCGSNNGIRGMIDV